MRNFQCLDVTENIVVYGNNRGDLMTLTFVESGLIKVSTFESNGLIGESFLDIGRLEGFNYQVKFPKNALAVFSSEQIKNLNVITEYIAGNYFCEISFMISKKILTTRQKLKKNLMSKTPTQITI